MNEELRIMKIQHIQEMIKNNLEFHSFVKSNHDKLPKTSILEYLDTKFSGLDTFLTIYLDFVEFLSPDEFVKFEKFRDEKHSLSNKA